MNVPNRTSPRLRAVRAARMALASALLLSGGALVAGCFDKPKIEDRWTRVDLQATNLTPNEVFPAGAVESVAVTAAITYRAIVTGYAVSELRASGSIAGGSVTVAPQAPRLAMAQQIDSILANSVSIGREARAITGWDHLIQTIHFGYRVAAPAMVPATGGGSASTTGLFMLTYLGSGVKVERRDGSDTVLVTPFPSTAYQILPVGMTLGVPDTTGP